MSTRRGLSRLAGAFLAVLVLTLTFVIVAHATQTITTPNALFVRYSLAAGTSSAAITPVAGQAVFVMGTQTELGFRGVGHVTLLRISGSFLEWVGLNSTSGASIAQGFSGAAGTHIVFLDFSHQVDIQVASPDSFLIHNASTGLRSGNVTLIW